MKSKIQSGNEAERYVKKYLEANGYTVHRTQRSFRRLPNGVILSRTNDIFHCIDIIAIKPNHKTLWIQVTRSSGIGKKLDKIKLVKWNLRHSDVQIWQQAGSSRWRILKYDTKNKKKLVPIAEIQRGTYMTIGEKK